MERTKCLIQQVSRVEAGPNLVAVDHTIIFILVDVIKAMYPPMFQWFTSSKSRYGVLDINAIAEKHSSMQTSRLTPSKL